MRKLLILSMLLMLLVPSARALTLPYPEDTVLSVADLTQAQRALADYLYTPIFNGREKIDLPKGTRYDDVAPAMAALMQDYPELFHLGRDYAVGYYTHAPEQATYIEPGYRMSSEEAAHLRATLYTQAYLLADAYPDAETLHDMLCSMVTGRLSGCGSGALRRHSACITR